MQRLYGTIEAHTTSKPQTVFGMEIPNWKKGSIYHEIDFANQVTQLFMIIEQFNALLAARTLPQEFEYFVHCKLYELIFNWEGRRH